MALGLHPVLPAESGLKPAVPAASPSKPSFSFKLPRQTLTRQPFGLGGHCTGIHNGPSWEETPRPPPPHCGALEAETPHCSPEGGPPCLQGTWNQSLRGSSYRDGPRSVPYEPLNQISGNVPNRRHHLLNGHEFKQTPLDSEG